MKRRQSKELGRNRVTSAKGWVALFSLVALLSTPCLAEVEQTSGRLDLSQWDPSTEGRVRLDGEWFFFDNELVEPTAILERLGDASTLVEVPSRWTSDFKALEGGAFGYATYAVKVSLPADANFWFETYGFQAAGTLTVLSLDGRVLAEGSSGSVGTDIQSELVVNGYPVEVSLVFEPGESRELVLVAQISNYAYPFGGFQKPLYVQELSAGRSAALFRIVLTASTLGVTIVIALYHLFLYYQRREDFLPVYFAGFCLSFAMRELVMSGLAERFGWRGFWTSYEVFVRLEYLSMPLVGGFAGLFIERLVSADWFTKFVRYWLGFYGTALIGLTLLTPVIIFNKYLLLYQLFLLVGIALILTHLIIETARKTTFALPILSAFLFLALGGVNDILHAQQQIDTAFVAPYTFIAFVLVQAGLIAQKFARAFKERDATQRALLETYHQLDEELLKREKLLESNERLKEENEIASNQLIQADKLATLGTMVAGVAHDIANPTGLITMNHERALDAAREGETLLDACFSDAEDEETLEVYRAFQAHYADTRDALAKVKLGSERIRAINGAIRNQSRIDTNRMREALRPLVEECLVIVGGRIKGVDVSIEVDETMEVNVIRSQFGQVLMNLLANAADAIHESTHDDAKAILIRAAEHEGRLELSIEDSGPGIAPELRAKILEPFFTTKAVGKGTGLGMPIVLRILKEHGMTLSIEDSQALGGACFRISA